MFEGILLKPSMVTPGADSTKREKPEVVADYTLKLLKRRVPPAVPGARPHMCPHVPAACARMCRCMSMHSRPLHAQAAQAPRAARRARWAPAHVPAHAHVPQLALLHAHAAGVQSLPFQLALKLLGCTLALHYWRG
jgi:hypothetical protein